MTAAILRAGARTFLSVRKHRNYRLFFTDDKKNPLTLLGYKDIRSDDHRDVWTDTTTLFTRILKGHVEPEGVTLDPIREFFDGRFRQFFNITLPLLSPTIFFVLVTSVIGTFQIFTQAYVITQGGPNDATLFYALLIYGLRGYATPR